MDVTMSESPSGPNNRRQHRRYYSQLAVEIATDSGDVLCTGEIRNLSAGGFMVALRAAEGEKLGAAVVGHFEHGTRLNFAVHMAMEPNRLDLPGTVRWYSESFADGGAVIQACGVQLYKLSLEQRRVWHYLVKTFRLRHPLLPAYYPGGESG